MQYRLEVQVQRPVMRIETQRAQVKIRQQRPQFQVQSQKAQMQIRRSRPQFQIQRGQNAWSPSQTSTFDLMKQFQSEGMQKSLEAIGRIATEGQRLRRIFDRHQSMARIVSDRLQHSVRVGMVAIPRAEMIWDPGEFEIEWTPYEQQLQWTMPEMVAFEVEPHQVMIELEQYPQVRFHFVYDDKERAAAAKKGS